MTGPSAWRGAELDRALATAKATGLPLEQVTRTHFPLDAMARRLDAVLDVASARRSTRTRRATSGHVFHDTTRKYGDLDVRGYISNAYLPYHTDGCDLAGLLCLRRAPRCSAPRTAW